MGKSGKVRAEHLGNQIKREKEIRAENGDITDPPSDDEGNYENEPTGKGEMGWQFDLKLPKEKTRKVFEIELKDFVTNWTEKKLLCINIFYIPLLF